MKPVHMGTIRLLDPRIRSQDRCVEDEDRRRIAGIKALS